MILDQQNFQYRVYRQKKEQFIFWCFNKYIPEHDMSTVKKVIELPPLDVAGKEIFTLYSILKS